MALKQDQRSGKLNTPLGQDVLTLARFKASEGLSDLFNFRIDAYSEQANLDFDAAIGRQCQVKIQSYEQERQFNGILTRAEWLGPVYELQHYRLVLRPWLWLLSRVSDCRIFQDKKAPDIITDVFTDRGFTDFELKLTANYPELEYCVQFRETDLDFVTRLMEQHGIYYFFKHEGDKHTLVLADSGTSHQPVPGQAQTPFVPAIGGVLRTRETIYGWSSERRFRTSKFELKDYNYLTPNADMKGEGKGKQSYTPELSFYDFPGKYKTQSDGDFYAKIRIEADQAKDRWRYADGDAISLFPGGLTTLQEHKEKSQNVQYLIGACSHVFTAQAYRAGEGLTAADTDIYRGAYEFFPADLPYRAPITTPKPRVYGIQTAKVVTKDENSSEEIDVEKLGEIYVRFYWDRKDKRSCRLRVAQVWAGRNWGGQIIPRVGQEVVVEFLEGDPDRPLVVGTVYNDEYKPPYELPADKTIGGLKSDSSKGGSGYNEWNFQDEKGSEQINVHAEKDLNVVIRNVETREIGGEYGQSPSRDTTIKQGDDKLSVQGGNLTIDVAQSISITAMIEIKLTVGPSSITINPSGITLSAPTINVNAIGPLALTGLPIKIN